MNELAKKKESTIVLKASEKKEEEETSDVDSDFEDEELMSGCNWRTKKM